MGDLLWLDSDAFAALEQKEGHVPPTLAVTSKLRHSKDIEVRNFEYLKSIVRE